MIDAAKVPILKLHVVETWNGWQVVSTECKHILISTMIVYDLWTLPARYASFYGSTLSATSIKNTQEMIIVLFTIAFLIVFFVFCLA